MPSHAAHSTIVLPAEGPKAAAPSTTVLPSRAVEGVAHAVAPAAGGPALPPHLQPAGGGGILPQKPRSHASVPVLAPGFVSPYFHPLVAAPSLCKTRCIHVRGQRSMTMAHS